ncbi:hypothetical protein [Tolypothrix sp. PCC 7601]|uniref:hypothetical protein n=1 Tax=Tolypothrix sp. PCC 7601 TaxID=1188 RepID=UPI0021DFAD14|nr:hypothetical protein [Tolypothrix sp. PCC 7601]
MMPAAYSVVRNHNIHLHETISKDGCWVRYLEGSRLDLKDIQFFWGSAALPQAVHTLLHEDKAKKSRTGIRKHPCRLSSSQYSFRDETRN